MRSYSGIKILLKCNIIVIVRISGTTLVVTHIINSPLKYTSGSRVKWGCQSEI
ncbi:Hypothetical protein CKL_2900 [Clostridium kluyveri DSM 555]|uniref:Uncharacterized protein n=1 Tax=Clostridium kluyveri (strain ATCC 8527 / DSM 555 / NBRC 12016 / NCIMB 10680 / K1) TaxID=431943 RepID=A5N1B6_CLOK5|nr:Hypothetical protein CKL_2900 [Clostridium kluyveri DSM 555]